MSLNKEILTTILKENVCDVTFTKKDGTERVMKSTLMEEYVKPLISNETTEKKERKENPNKVCVVDLEKNAWRSFNADTVKGIRLTEIVKENIKPVETVKDEVVKPLSDEIKSDMEFITEKLDAVGLKMKDLKSDIYMYSNGHNKTYDRDGNLVSFEEGNV